MYPYTVEGLARETDAQRHAKPIDGQEAVADADGASQVPVANEEAEEIADCHNPCTKYRLKGVVVHQGSASAGHYYTYIRVRKTPETVRSGMAGRWLKFNDDSVTEEKVRLSTAALDTSDLFVAALFGARVI
jgi:ubiquitin carboxyl-terminal hydrolase 9/24